MPIIFMFNIVSTDRQLDMYLSTASGRGLGRTNMGIRPRGGIMLGHNNCKSCVSRDKYVGCSKPEKVENS